MAESRRLIEPVFRPIGQDRRVEEDTANLDTGGFFIGHEFEGALSYFRFGRARDVGQPGWRQASQITKELHAPHWHWWGDIVGHREAPVVVAPRSLSACRQEAVRGRAITEH